MRAFFLGVAVEERNELQKIQRKMSKEFQTEAKRQRQELVLWYESELKNGNLATKYKSLNAFDGEEWNTSMTSSTVDGIISGTTAGLGDVYSIASVSKTSEYFLNIKNNDITLAESLRDSAKEAEKIALDTINKHLEHKTTVTRLTKELTAKNVSKGDLPKYLKELSSEVKFAGGDTPKMRRLIKDAESRISKLAQDGAPTKYLQNAYSKVLVEAKKGDVASLNKALKNAVDKKAVYNNERIARTELSQAYSKGFARQLEDHPLGDNAFVRVSLSSNHTVPDVCDYYTEADLHNRGSGVYPQDEVPNLPLHPHCGCMYSITAVRDIDKRTTRFSEQRGNEYLNSLDEETKRRVLVSKEYTKVKKLKALPKDQVKKM